MNKKQKDLFLIIAILVFFTVIIVSGIICMNYATSHNYDEADNLPVTETKEELLALLNSGNVTIEKTSLQETETVNQMTEEVPGNTEVIEALTDQAVTLKDVYSEKGEPVFFKCFDKDAESYVWEYYDITAGKWTAPDNETICLQTDELGRNVSVMRLNADEATDEFMIRCTIYFDTKETETQTASLHVIGKIKEFSIEDLETDANRYLGSNELPITAVYEDGSKEELSGLNGLYFIATEESTDYDSSVSGNRIETTTIISTESQYLNTGFDRQETLVRYRTNTSDKIETICSITGKDTKPPEISDVEISPFEISSIDKPVNLTITITAEDDITPYPKLEYAFLYSDQELTESDWMKKSSFDVCIERNGIYSAYVRDQSGNIGKLEKEIITVDTKAPVIASVSLSDSEGWCKCNTISVTARDAGEISYLYESIDNGINSGWISYSNYTADSNGTWIIKAKDAVGNISESEIIISNIDKEAPVIQRISVK